ncbi:MAG: hypothetical protein ACJ71A_07885, partial [Nitrososphaeraceae archaeon]
IVNTSFKFSSSAKLHIVIHSLLILPYISQISSGEMNSIFTLNFRLSFSSNQNSSHELISQPYSIMAEG